MRVRVNCECGSELECEEGCVIHTYSPSYTHTPPSAPPLRTHTSNKDLFKQMRIPKRRPSHVVNIHTPQKGVHCGDGVFKMPRYLRTF